MYQVESKKKTILPLVGMRDTCEYVCLDFGVVVGLEVNEIKLLCINQREIARTDSLDLGRLRIVRRYGQIVFLIEEDLAKLSRSLCISN